MSFLKVLVMARLGIAALIALLIAFLYIAVPGLNRFAGEMRNTGVVAMWLRIIFSMIVFLEPPWLRRSCERGPPQVTGRRARTMRSCPSSSGRARHQIRHLTLSAGQSDYRSPRALPE